MEKNITFEGIFNEVFSEYPTEANSKKIAVFNENLDDPNEKKVDKALFDFQFLIDLYMTAMNDIERLGLILYDKQPRPHENYPNIKFELDKLMIDHLNIPQKWFLSLGIFIHIREYNEEELDDLYLNYYCKIILKDNPDDAGYFYLRKIKTPYHFIINSKFDKVSKLQDITALLYKPGGKTMFSIAFSTL